MKYIVDLRKSWIFWVVALLDVVVFLWESYGFFLLESALLFRCGNILDVSIIVLFWMLWQGVLLAGFSEFSWFNDSVDSVFDSGVWRSWKKLEMEIGVLAGSGGSAGLETWPIHPSFFFEPFPYHAGMTTAEPPITIFCMQFFCQNEAENSMFLIKFRSQKRPKKRVITTSAWFATNMRN